MLTLGRFLRGSVMVCSEATMPPAAEGAGEAAEGQGEPQGGALEQPRETEGVGAAEVARRLRLCPS